MILMVHFLFGAAIVSKIRTLLLARTLIPSEISYLTLAFVLAFLSHYLLDSLPHWDYSIENIQEKKWRNSFKDFLKVFLDISLGIFLIFIFSKNFSISFLGGLVAILPDGLILLNLIYPSKLLTIHKNFHQKIHFPESPEGEQAPYGAGKKISPFWEIAIEIIIFFLAIYLLR